MSKQAKLQVKIIANTELIGDDGLIFDGMALDLESTYMDDLAEYAGRSCYESFHKPNEATRSNKDYLANILKQGHESVLAHASVTFRITGMSRACAHEMIRSRFLAFSEISQRFVNANDLGFVVPPALENDDFGVYKLKRHHEVALEYYDIYVEKLRDEGLSRKQAREAARSFLPLCTETRMVVSGNIRAWRDFIKQRDTEHADIEIRRVAQHILEELKVVAPNSVVDL